MAHLLEIEYGVKGTCITNNYPFQVYGIPSFNYANFSFLGRKSEFIKIRLIISQMKDDF
jgi:hypothetical protein